MQKIILKNLEIYSINSKKINTTNNDFYIDKYSYFPTIINNDGSIWKDGTLFLLNKLKQYKIIDRKRLDSIAFDIMQFKKWCERENINYLTANRRISAPTYQYKSHLIKILRGEKTDSDIKITSSNTFKRKMSSILLFYRYLIEIEKIEFRFPLWQDIEIDIAIKDSNGFMGTKKVVSTDITKGIGIYNNSSNKVESILDGRVLHPLTQNEQIQLFEALQLIGNTEMTLAFLISISTGARISTVLTLRKKHFTKHINNEEGEVIIPVGFGTDCDNKNDKNYNLHMPKFIYEKIQIYLQSERYEKKTIKAKFTYEDNKQYIFLTNQGNPYYISKYDPYRDKYKSPPDGATLRTFIIDTLKPMIQKQNYKVRNFSFHDIRATFGMNLVDSLLKKVDQELLSISQVLNMVQTRMGHSSLKTTERYLDFRSKNKLNKTIQDDYENYLIELLNES